ncbi:PhzF family phenazine biosynthesis protein [Pendulispora albinea]|uniref:PhzF family phenazine biosynthesis protein n=1 Tax=Pendulispora albinea TaxID=2741071 RepID=A0ABZ2LS13_9BACT
MATKNHFKFYWVDVFATEPLGGNPLPVVLDADRLDEATMKLVTREFNQAETTFILKPTQPGATHRLRSFTVPGHEVSGAGHNALGAWWALAARGHLKADSPEVTFHQELGEHVLPVDVLFEGQDARRIVMKHATPAFGATVSDPARIAASLGLEPGDIDLARFPAQVVSTGAPHCLIPVRNRGAIDRAKPDAERLLSLLRDAGGEGCYVFSLDPVDPAATAYARFFNPTVGIYEDSATGTAAGPLSVQLVAKGVVPDGSTVIIEQGFAMGRPSRIEMRVRGDDVRLYGAGIVIAEGELFI